MKTHLIHLDGHDDVISASDKMGWAKSPRILLLLPDNERILTRRLDLVLLLRRSIELGAQLALVTRDAGVRIHAHELDIPVFDSARQAQTVRWRSPRRRKIPRLRTGKLAQQRIYELEEIVSVPRRPRTGHLRLRRLGRAAIFTVSMLALLALAAMILPGAEISLTPQTQIQEMELEILASPSVAAIKLTGEIPAHWVTVSVEGRQSISTTGSIEIPAGAAAGYVRFTSMSDESVNIPTGTVVTTLDVVPLRFATTSSGTIEAGASNIKFLQVRALNPGKSGNIATRKIQAVEGPLGFSVTVTNLDKFKGGGAVFVAAPTASDRQALYNQLLASLSASAQAEILSGLEPGDRLITFEPLLSSEVEKTYLPAAATPANQIQLTLRQEFKALIVSNADIRQYTTAILDASLPTQYLPIPDTLEITEESTPTLTTETGDEAAREIARWRIKARRTLQAQLPGPEAIQPILGLPPSQAIQQLASALPLASPPEVKLTPPWWPRLPLVPFRIQMVEE